jgi:hypothetical protein
VAAGCPLNKGGRALLLAKRMNWELRVFGRVILAIAFGWESGWGVRLATWNVRHRTVVGKAASRHGENSSGMRGVCTHAALFGVLSEGASLHGRSKLARVNSPSRSAAYATRANGLFRRTEESGRRRRRKPAEVHAQANTVIAT